DVSLVLRACSTFPTRGANGFRFSSYLIADAVFLRSRPMRTKSIFQLLSEYHTSLDNMRSWLHDSTLDEVERMGIIDAWQEEMKQYFQKHGFCFACNRPLGRCRCAEAL